MTSKHTAITLALVAMVALAGCQAGVASAPSSGSAAQPASARSRAAEGPTKRPVDPLGSGTTLPRLIEEGYLGYNIVQWLDRYYAVPQGQGAFSEETARRGEYVSAEGPLLLKPKVEVRAIIDREQGADTSPTEPILVREGYRGYNLVRFEGRTHAVAQGSGAFVVSRRDQYLSAASYAELKPILDEQVTAEFERHADADPTTPILLEEGVSGFNLVRYGRRTYALPQDQGGFDFARIKSGGIPGALEGESAATLRAALPGRPPSTPGSTR